MFTVDNQSAPLNSACSLSVCILITVFCQLAIFSLFKIYCVVISVYLMFILMLNKCFLVFYRNKVIYYITVMNTFVMIRNQKPVM